MTKFHLVDLERQKEAVVKYTENWSRCEILTWISQLGSIVEPEKHDSVKVYIFEANSGAKAAFQFTETDEISVISSGWIG